MDLGIPPEDLRKSFGVKLWQDTGAITEEVRVKTTRLKPLTQKVNFNLATFLHAQPAATAPSSIFTLWRDFQNAENDIKEMCREYTGDYAKWRQFTENIKAVASESNHYVNNYEKSMEIVKDEGGKEIETTFPLNSHYPDNGNYVNISDWVWKRNDGKDKFY